MAEVPDPVEPSPPPFPGDGFWKLIESAATSIGLGSPRNIFKIRKARARWEARREADRNVGRGVTYTHKTCPACGRLVERAKAECPYCGANVRWAPGPGLMRILGLSVPHGSTAMALVAANVLLYAITTFATMASTGQDPLSALFRPASSVLFHMGSLDPAAVLLGQVWRLWTYQFLHFGALHIIFNMMALFSLGPTTEDVYGPWKTMVVYWATGVSAGLVSMGMRFFSVGLEVLQIDPHVLLHRLPATVGASGSIFGLIGVLIGHTIRRGGAQGAYLRRFLVQWAVYGLVMGFMIGADNAAHVGGLVSGILLGLIVSDRRSLGPSILAWRVAAGTVVVLILYGFAVAAFVAPPEQAPWPDEPDARLEAPRPVGYPCIETTPARHPGTDIPCATLPPCSGSSTRGAAARLWASGRSPSHRAPSC
jgi:rhomboid protease GluP